MITCQLFKSNQNHIAITPHDNDLISEHSVAVELQEEVVEEMLEIQDKYRKLQRRLRNMLELQERVI